MPDITVSSDIDSFLQAANNAAAKTALGAASLSHANDFSVNGAASTPAMKLTGTIFTGGSATTTKPQLLVEPGGTTTTGWSTSGTLIGANAPNAFAGMLFDGQVNGVPAVRLFANGSLAVGNTGSSGAGYIQSEGNTAIYAFGLLMRSDAQVAWSSTGGYSGTKDVFLNRDAAGILSLKNSTNAQTFRIYGNTTGSHYLNMTHNGTNAVLSVNGGGTLHISSLPTANPGPGILWNNAGTPAIGT
jgi:hypothetical protein